MLNFRKKAWIPVLILLAAILLAGCGSPAADNTDEQIVQNSETPAQIVEDETPTAAVSTKNPPEVTSDTTAASTENSPEDTESGLPEELPAELQSVADLNDYAANLWINYVKANIFEAPVFSDEEKDDARKALNLIIAAEDKAIAMVPDNEHLYYLRGTAYAECYYDTQNAEYKEKALADLKVAADLGLDMAQTEYDKVSGK